MKGKLITIFGILLTSLLGHAQPPGNYWSNLPCKIDNKEDSDFIFGIHKRVRYNYLSNYDGSQHKLKVWDGNQNFRTLYTVEQASVLLKDSTTFDAKFRSWYDMCILWNRTADTLNIISFSPIYHYGGSTWWPDPCWHSIFDRRHRFVLNEFWSMMTSGEQQKYNAVLVAELSELLTTTEWERPAILKKDTLFRIDEIHLLRDPPRCEYDSKGWSFHWLFAFLKDGIINGKITGYRDSLCTKPIMDPSAEENWTYWDTTNYVENPDKPGEFIHAPIKYLASMHRFKIFEIWYPVSQNTRDTRFTGHLSYARYELAYGLGLHHTIWVNANEAKAYLSAGGFNFVPYQEVFRAKRYETMWITSDWD